METFSALLVICAGNSPVPGECPAQRPLTRSFDVLFDLRLNKGLSKQSWGWWFGTLLRPLWRHCNDRITLSIYTDVYWITCNFLYLVFPSSSPLARKWLGEICNSQWSLCDEALILLTRYVLKWNEIRIFWYLQAHSLASEKKIHKTLYSKMSQ